MIYDMIYKKHGCFSITKGLSPLSKKATDWFRGTKRLAFFSTGNFLRDPIKV
jgi:hypothetical protein